MTTWVSLAIAIIGLAVLVIKEFYGKAARDRAEEAELDLAQKALEQSAQAALLKLRESAAKESSQAGEAWDQADQGR